MTPKIDNPLPPGLRPIIPDSKSNSPITHLLRRPLHVAPFLPHLPFIYIYISIYNSIYIYI